MGIIKTIKQWVSSFKKQEETKKPVAKAKKTLEEKLMSADEETRNAYYRHLANKHQVTLQHTKERVANREYDKQDFQKKIRFEFVPKNQSNRNVRSYLEYVTGDYKKWQSIRDYFEVQSDSVCSICGQSSTEFGVKHHTECHEVWYYDYNTRLQTLKRLEALCIVCHSIKHLNQHIKDKEKFDILLKCYADLNACSIEVAMSDYQKAIDIRYSRKNVKYKLELSYLKQFGEEIETFDCFSDDFQRFLDRWIQNNND